MSRSPHQKVVLASAALGFGAVIALSGCSAGQETQTDTQVAAVNGASGTVQDLAVRNAEFTFPSEQPYYPTGSSVPVEAVLSNNGSTGDRLVQVSSPYAESVEVGGFTTLPAYSAVHAYGASQGPGPGVEGAPSAQREVKITLRKLDREIGPGVTIPVTFVFQKSGSTTVQVPIAADPSTRQEHGSGEAH